jgi:hypothetical protein
MMTELRKFKRLNMNTKIILSFFFMLLCKRSNFIFVPPQNKNAIKSVSSTLKKHKRFVVRDDLQENDDEK